MSVGTGRHVVLSYTAIADEMLKGRGKSGEKDKSRLANVSALAPAADDLWTAADEEASIERLRRKGERYVRAQAWRLTELFPAFAEAFKKAEQKGKGREADLEGLAYDRESQRLWMVGSHCLSRGSMDHVKPKALRKRTKPDSAPLRTLLGFVPLKDGAPVADGGLALPLGEGRGSLRAAIRAEDGYLAEAIRWPAKENGLDIEGIAVSGTQVLLGLRGPAVGGFAIVMRLAVEIGRERLALRKRDGRRYKLTFLQLNGLGIRDLLRDGEDVLVLAGPTMDLDAPFALYRWRGAFDGRAPATEKLEPGSERLEFLLDFPVPERAFDDGRPTPHERPEGIALLPRKALLVVHDRPARWRLEPKGTLKADILDLARRRKRHRGSA